MKRFLTTLGTLALIGAVTEKAAAQYPGMGPYPAPGMVGAMPGYGPPAMMPGYGAMPGYGPPAMMPGYGGMPGYAPMPGYGAPPPGAAPAAQASSASCEECKYGFHPALKRVFHIHGTCSKHSLGLLHHDGDSGWLCKLLGRFGPPGGGGPEMGPGPTGGTLAFPNHPFVRSPRDYFMTEDP